MADMLLPSIEILVVQIPVSKSTFLTESMHTLNPTSINKVKEGLFRVFCHSIEIII